MTRGGPGSPTQNDLGHRRARVATATAFAAQGLMLTALFTHLPQFTDRYGVSEGTVTLIVLMVTVLAGVGSLLIEMLAVATSSATALRFGLLVIAVAGAAVGLAPGLPSFVLAFAVYGLGLGAVDAATNMQGVAVQHRYGRSIITSFHAAWSAGAIIGALYVAGGERLSLSLPASLVPVGVAVLLILVIAGPYLLPADTPADAPADRDPAPAAGVRAETVPAATAFAVTSGPLLLIGLAMICFWSVDSGIASWSALYLRDVLGAADSAAALGYAAYQGTALLSRLAGDVVVRRLGPVTTVRAAAAIGTTGALLVVLAPGPVVAIIGFGFAGLGLPVIAPLCFSAAGATVRATGAGGPAQEHVPDAVVDSVVARLNIFNYLGSLLGAVLVGGVATISDLRVGFAVTLVLATALLFLARAFAPASTPR